VREWKGGKGGEGKGGKGRGQPPHPQICWFRAAPENMTLFTRPGVRNIFDNDRTVTTDNMHGKFVAVWSVVFEICEQTDAVIAIRHALTTGE